MNTTLIEQFNIIGIAVRTTNENGRSAIDIPQLWNRFFSEGISVKIPNKIDDTLYCIYTDYEKDHTKPYTTILGCKVDSLEIIPKSFTSLVITKGNYLKFSPKGKIADGIVFKEWTKIWNTDLPRTFTTDFEVYGDKAQDPDDAEIDIFVGVK